MEGVTAAPVSAAADAAEEAAPAPAEEPQAQPPAPVHEPELDASAAATTCVPDTGHEDARVHVSP